jgi:putative CGCGG family rSAM target protein
MATDDHGHDDGHANGDAVDEERHENSWSADLETAAHAGDSERVVADAKRAIENTAPGYHVNLVTHGENGHPETYLFEPLDDLEVDYEFVQQCGCGGYVTRVQV